ncbi:MAG: hypothetical protein M1834_009409 [Cirrosporium novae-zelandiae]|nr:MAG: hypothetical protein M1834_009409 [Cirrosporium novae-zelandiae]
MSSAKMSPAASLLRNSRVFSLPPPLPRSGHDLGMAVYASDTATLPYPTHAAIETTPSSLARGDWGLKRNLPLRSTTRTTTPVLRIKGIDTNQHITEFESAADHVLTLQKFQQLNIPISIPPRSSMRRETLRSVFDDEFDPANPDPTDMNQKRWKFKGPWLAAKDEGGFQHYIQRTIRRKRPEFRAFLRQHLAQVRYTEARMKATNRGRQLPSESDFNPALITDAELRSYIRELRQQTKERSNIHASPLDFIIFKFLDLPTHPSASLFSETGPPPSHPSGGLSYLRTSSIITNHPLLGPQEQPPPVPAIVLKPSRGQNGYLDSPALGVAGVAVEFRKRDLRQVPTFKDQDLTSFNNRDIGVGDTVYVQPLSAHIDNEGRIRMDIDLASQDTIAIAQGNIEKPPAATWSWSRNGNSYPYIKPLDQKRSMSDSERVMENSMKGLKKASGSPNVNKTISSMITQFKDRQKYKPQ